MVWLPTSTEEEGLTEEMEKIKGDDRREFYAHIFNGCYAGLMFIVVIFFLIYGVEVFFKVRGGFTIQNVPKIINSRRHSTRKIKASEDIGADEIVSEEQKP